MVLNSLDIRIHNIFSKALRKILFKTNSENNMMNEHSLIYE